MEGTHVAGHEGPQGFQDDARGALVGAAQVDDQPLERLVADEAREGLLDAVDGLLAGERDDAQVADPGCRLQPPRLGQDERLDAAPLERHLPRLLPRRDDREGDAGAFRTPDVSHACAGVASDGDDAVPWPDARLLGRAAVEDVRDAQALTALARRAGVHERADAAVAGIDRLVGIAEVLRREEAGVRILEQGDHLAQQLVDLVGVVRGDDERRVLVADGLPVKPVRLRVHVGVADALPDSLEEPDAIVLRHRERLLRDRCQRGLRLHARRGHRGRRCGRGLGRRRARAGILCSRLGSHAEQGDAHRQHSHQAPGDGSGLLWSHRSSEGRAGDPSGSMLPRFVGMGDLVHQLTPVTVLADPPLATLRPPRLYQQARPERRASSSLAASRRSSAMYSTAPGQCCQPASADRVRCG